MTWDKTTPTKAKYRDREYQHTRTRLIAQLRREGSGLCAELVCVAPSRLITPDMKLHLCHAPDGVAILGLGHRRCNMSAACHTARRNDNRRKARLSPIW